jgi:starch phosphorylase
VLSADAGRRARELAAWKERVLAAWGSVKIEEVETDTAVAGLGAERTAVALIHLGELSPADVEVQLVHGTVGQADELDHPTVAPMAVTDTEGGHEGATRYAAFFRCDRAGRYGCTVRVVPSHPDLASPVELGRITWA